MTQPRLGLQGTTPEHFSDEQRKLLADLRQLKATASTPEQAALADRMILELCTKAADLHALELNRQLQSVMLHAPGANEPDWVLEAFLDQNPLVSRAWLLRLLMHAVGSGRSSVAARKRVLRLAGQAGGLARPQSQAAAELKAWADLQNPQIGPGRVASAARRLAAKVPEELRKRLADPERILRDHLYGKQKTTDQHGQP